MKFDDCGVKYGWAGNQAVLYVEPEALMSHEGYDEFLKKLSDLPVPKFLKTMKEEIVETAGEEVAEETVEQEDPEDKKKTPAFLNVAKKVLESGADAIEKVSKQVAVKSEEIFRNKSLMKRQMLFYGAIHLYKDGLENFMNQ